MRYDNLFRVAVGLAAKALLLGALMLALILMLSGCIKQRRAVVNPPPPEPPAPAESLGP